MPGEGMRLQDRQLFMQAAQETGLWILVRETNMLSAPYFGQPGYTPKPFACKAKTADEGPNAGLVVAYDEKEADKIYGAKKKGKAKECWEHFLQSNPFEHGYSIEMKGVRHGCIKYNDDYIYSDYDLFDIVHPNHVQANLGLVEFKDASGQTIPYDEVDEEEHMLHYRSPWQRDVAEAVNGKFGYEVIQHSGEMQYASFKGQSNIDVFGPKHNLYAFLRTEAQIRDFYKHVFMGRTPIGGSFRRR
jgi:hypothetical protein